MAINFSNPDKSQPYDGGLLLSLREHQVALAQMLDSTLVTITGLPPTGAKRFNKTSRLFEEFNGTSLATLDTAYVSSVALQAYVPRANPTMTGVLSVDGNVFYNNGVVFANTLNSFGANDPLELVFSSGSHVVVGSGPTGSKPLYASNLFANGSAVWTAANDGSGSGLDADLLDGLQGDRYLKNTIDFWHVSNEGQNRFYWGGNGRSYFGSANGYEWRRNVDDFPLMQLGNDATLLVAGGATVNGSIVTQSHITAAGSISANSNITAAGLLFARGSTKGYGRIRTTPTPGAPVGNNPGDLTFVY